LFRTAELSILENPWPHGTTGDLLSKAIQDVDLEGNFYAYRDGNRLRRMRPDWVSIRVGCASERDLVIIGYGYHPGVCNSREPVMVMDPDEVIHWAPIPDPEARFRGMSWITPIIREIQADDAATEHQLGFWEHGATPNMIARLPQEMTKEKFDEWVTKFREGHEGSENAYKTLFLGGGADVSVVGATLAQADFKTIQGAGETRIAAASGMPPIIVGLSEGLSYATYSNYGQARRHAADACLRPLWRARRPRFRRSSTFPVVRGSGMTIATSCSSGGSAGRGNDHQHESVDHLDAARCRFEATSAIAAVNANDFSFPNHTGLFSVQLQPIATPEIYMAQVMAGVQQQESAIWRRLIDAGFEPIGDGRDRQARPFSALAYRDVWCPVGADRPGWAGEGLLVQGEVVPAGAGQNSVRALLEPFLDERSE
jgi:hypothetical protein